MWLSRKFLSAYATFKIDNCPFQARHYFNMDFMGKSSNLTDTEFTLSKHDKKFNEH